MTMDPNIDPYHHHIELVGIKEKEFSQAANNEDWSCHRDLISMENQHVPIFILSQKTIISFLFLHENVKFFSLNFHLFSS